MNHLERALDNQNQWWKYLVIILAGFLAANFIGAIPLMIVIAHKIAQNGGIVGSSDNIADLSIYGISPNIGLFLMLLPFIVGLFTVILLLKPLHKRSYKEVINGTNKIRWNRFFFALIIWAILMLVYFVIGYFLDPGNFQFSFNLNYFIVLVIISVLLIPFQTTYEEILFRGYFSQGLAALTRNRWIVLIVPALLFGLMHAFNPEVKEFGFWITMPQYWLFGLLFGLTTILDDGIEIAMGVHAANNVFSSILVTTKSSVLQTPALFLQNNVEPVKETIIFAFICLIFLVILTRKYNWKYSVLGMRVQKDENIISQEEIAFK